MEVKSTDSKTFRLIADGQPLGELVYRNRLFLSAEIKLADAGVYAIKPVGIFGTRISISEGGAEIATLHMDWCGRIVFAFHGGEAYTLKAQGILHDTYIVENRDGERLIAFDPKINWNHVNYDFGITFGSEPPADLVIMVGLYAANYLIASLSGAMAGMA